jgi:carboxypeptidase C (cathepsin A)
MNNGPRAARIRRMKPRRALVALCALTVSLSVLTPAFAAGSMHAQAAAPTSGVFTPREVTTYGSVTVSGHKIAYRAVAGTIIVHPPGWDDAAVPPTGKDAIGTANGPPVASMFYVAYFKRGVPARDRPITFLYNGGPGSSSLWLDMGAYGPVRVVTNSSTHTPPAPYHLVNNQYSLLNVSDLVFIDAPGTGYSRIEGKGKDKAFYGVDQDANAFASFIIQFLSRFHRWNSPKYLYGESYGTPRSAVLIYDLEVNNNIDFNGVILQSQILNFDLSADDPQHNPGIELPYELALPSMAATAWYHHVLPAQPAHLRPLLRKVERFAMGPYADALAEGSALPRNQERAIAEKLHGYTGLPVSYLLKADLQVSGLMFEHELLNSSDETTGRLDTRFEGPSINPLNERAQYDPLVAGIGSAYVSAFNDYLSKVLHYRTSLQYLPMINVPTWQMKHQPPNASYKLPIAVNVMPDLAYAMKYNPDLKICLNGGYFDLATPFYEGWYEMHHLQIPRSLDKNIQYHYYKSGHMIYVRVAALKKLHKNVAAFIRQTDNLKG